MPYHALLSLLYTLPLSAGFQIVSYSQHEQSFHPGQTLSLSCKADSAWEFCLWKHVNKKKAVERECLMEWKRAKGGVSVERCNDSLSARVSISGDYNSHTTTGRGCWNMGV